MDRNAYLHALNQALAAQVPDQERADILRYYEEYFDEAGPEGEAAVIEELGDPLELARRLAAEGGYGQPAAAGQPTAGAAAPRKRRNVLLAVAIAAAILVLAALGAAAAALAGGWLPWKTVSAGAPNGQQGGIVDNTPAPEPDAVSPAPDDGAADTRNSIVGERFSEIDVEVSVADVTIVTGEAYAVELKWDDGYGYTMDCAVRKDVLKVTSAQKSVGDPSFDNAEVIITVPADVTLKEIDVEVGMGDLRLEGISAADISCESGSGDIRFLRVTANEVSGEAGLGDVEWEGPLSRETELNTGMGDIRVKADGASAGWSYELSSGTGQVSVNGVSYGSYAKQRGGSGELEVFSGMGDVTVEFLGEQ